MIRLKFTIHADSNLELQSRILGHDEYEYPQGEGCKCERCNTLYLYKGDETWDGLVIRSLYTCLSCHVVQCNESGSVCSHCQGELYELSLWGCETCLVPVSTPITLAHCPYCATYVPATTFISHLFAHAAKKGKK